MLQILFATYDAAQCVVLHSHFMFK